MAEDTGDDSDRSCWGCDMHRELTDEEKDRPSWQGERVLYMPGREQLEGVVVCLERTRLAWARSRTDLRIPVYVHHTRARNCPHHPDNWEHANRGPASG